MLRMSMRHDDIPDLRAVLRIGILLGICMMGSRSGTCQDTSSEEMRAWVEKLGSPVFQERTEAMLALVPFVEKSPETAEEFVEVSDREPAARLVQLLECVFLKHDSELGDRAERALERIARGESFVATQARSVLTRNARVRESRARRAIESLGGELVYLHPEYERVSRLMPAAEPLAPVTGVGFGEPAILSAVWLHENWKGGNDALWHIERLRHWRDLTLYSIRGNGVDTLNLFQLAAVVPGLHFAERGPCLGIQGGLADGICIVDVVLPGSAAEKGGVQPGDQVRYLNELRIISFQHLVESLKDYQIGNVVRLTVARPGEGLLDLTIRLTSWREVHRSNGEVDAPLPFGGPLAPERTVPPPVPKPRRLVREITV